MGRSSFKKILRDIEKKEAPQARKPWENEISQPHYEARENSEIVETTGAHGVQRGSAASTDSKPFMEASDVSGPKDTNMPNPAPAQVSSHAGTLEIYTDESVCRVLGIRRRVLADARTAVSKGTNWDAFKEEVGMTRKWVYDYATSHGICPDFFNGGLEKVSGDYVSVRLVGTTPNLGLVQVELEATGKREFARTKNIMQFPIHYLEVFSCMRIHLPADEHLEWVSRPNEVKY